MATLDINRRTQIAVLSLASLAGCGGAVSTGSVPTAMTPSVAHHGTSTSGALIYATGGCGGICVVSYPKGQIVASISASRVGVPCSDNAGNVFVPNETQVLEYAHGGTTPIATLTLSKTPVNSYNCAVDPTTNDLAVTYLSSTSTFVAVFSNESGSPIVYFPKIDAFFCGYDDAGNLFVDGYYNSNVPTLSELRYGQSTFIRLSTSGLLGSAGQVQWDGSYLTLENIGDQNIATTISRLSISGYSATVVSTAPLNGNTNRTTLSWIYGGNVLLPYSIRAGRVNRIGIWPYPHGGGMKSAIKFKKSRGWLFDGLTVSSASK